MAFTQTRYNNGDIDVQFEIPEDLQIFLPERFLRVLYTASSKFHFQFRQDPSEENAKPNLISGMSNSKVLIESFLQICMDQEMLG